MDTFDVIESFLRSGARLLWWLVSFPVRFVQGVLDVERLCPQEEEKKSDEGLRGLLSWGSRAFVVFVVVAVLLSLLLAFLLPEDREPFKQAAQFGETFSSLMSGLGAFALALTILSLALQREELRRTFKEMERHGDALEQQVTSMKAQQAAMEKQGELAEAQKWALREDWIRTEEKTLREELEEETGTIISAINNALPHVERYAELHGEYLLLCRFQSQIPEREIEQKRKELLEQHRLILGALAPLPKYLLDVVWGNASGYGTESPSPPSLDSNGMQWRSSAGDTAKHYWAQRAFNRSDSFGVRLDEVGGLSEEDRRRLGARWRSIRSDAIDFYKEKIHRAFGDC